MIGVFDSGVGGLIVAKELKRINPNEPIIYFGDTARLPWGIKSKRAVERYSHEIVDFLLSKGVTRIVIACNTASAFALQYLCRSFSHITFHDVINPCVNVAKKRKKGSILVIGTRATIESGVYEQLLRFSSNDIFSQDCPLFVPLIEEGLLKGDILDRVIAKYLSKYRRCNIRTVVLGCTHYSLIVHAIENFFDGKIDIVDSAKEVAKEVESDLQNKYFEQVGKDEYYFSDFSSHNRIMLERIFAVPVEINIYRLK